MKIGIYDINLNSTLDYKTRIDIYKKVGFNCLGTYVDNDYMYNNESYIDIIQYAQSIGLTINQVHADYKLADFLLASSTNVFFDYLENKLRECENFGIKNIVLHASRQDDSPLITSEQLNKVRDIAQRHLGINLCFENIVRNDNLFEILKLDIPNIKMCYDLGHAHAYSNEHKLLLECKKYIACSHLHNNFGKDTHNLLSCGEIDYKDVVKQLATIKDCDLCLEVFPAQRGEILENSEFEKFVQMAYCNLIDCLK